MPTSRCTSNESAWLLIRADARGLSGMLIASTPTDFKNLAPSSSLRISVPRGGTISTMVTNAPEAILDPSEDRSAKGRAGKAAGRVGSPLTATVDDFDRASPTRRADFITRI